MNSLLHWEVATLLFFSCSRGIPILFFFSIDFAQEVRFSCVEFGIDEEQLCDSYLRAMKSSFCPEEEKTKILGILEKRMGYQTERGV
jgi:adenosine deaminase